MIDYMVEVPAWFVAVLVGWVLTDIVTMGLKAIRDSREENR